MREFSGPVLRSVLTARPAPRNCSNAWGSATSWIREPSWCGPMWSWPLMIEPCQVLKETEPRSPLTTEGETTTVLPGPGGRPQASDSLPDRGTHSLGPSENQPNTNTQTASVLERDRMKKEMLINVLQPEECRIAIVENGVLEELYVERTSHESYTGNIYKGKVVNLEPAIQAAFVDFSVGRNGFLHVSDVEPQYYDRHQPHGEEIEPTGRPGPGPTPGSRPRDPRRGRDRDDRRRSRPAPPSEAFPPPLPAPPRGEDRNRDRERPDRSVRGRRDRSEMPRRFGEGLGDERDAADQPAAPPEPTSFEPPAHSLDEPAHSSLESESSLWAETVGRDWDPDRERERERERDLDRERQREREFRQVEPEEPRW